MGRLQLVTAADLIGVIGKPLADELVRPVTIGLAHELEVAFELFGFYEE